MKTTADTLLERANDITDFFEMANIKPLSTGLSIYVYVSVKQHSSSARIKAMNVKNKPYADDNFSVLISNEPAIVAGKSKLSKKELNDVFSWVKLNKKLLLNLWNKKIDFQDFYTQVKSI